MKKGKDKGIIAEVGRFTVTKAGEVFTLFKDGVEIEIKDKREILSNKKDWRGFVPEYTVASMLLESWLNKRDNYVNTNVKVGG